MFRIVTFNANGVRSALTKGFFNWFQAQNADVLCIQELKAQEKDIPAEVAGLPGYQAFFHCAEKKGYSGCGIWCRRKPDEVRYGFGDPEFDAEGRYVEAIFGDLSVISCYFPSGSSSEERQEAKFRFLASFLKHMDELRTSGRRVILCGDVNIAHKEIDLKNWKGNVKNSGFLPEERRLAHRLSSGHRKRGGRRPRCVDLSGREVLGSCAAHHRLRLFSRGLTNAAQGRAFFPGLRHAL